MALTKLWEKFSKELRDSRQHCQSCGTGASLTVHHGYYRSRAAYHDYGESTLWVLCWSCHTRHERELHRIKTFLGTVPPTEYSKLYEFLSTSGFGNTPAAEQEYERTVDEIEQYLPSNFELYEVSVVSNTDLGPSAATRIVSEVQRAFPSINWQVDKSDCDPDGMCHVFGPQEEVRVMIQEFLARISP